MDAEQEREERRAGDLLFEWYNKQHGTSFRFDKRPCEAPDLSYRDGKRLLQVEVVKAHYDERDDARFQSMNNRGKPNAPHKWSGKNFEEDLVKDISAQITAKCAKAYGPHCLLAVYVFLSLTRADEMEGLVKHIVVPAKHCFEDIYLCADCAPDLHEYFSGIGIKPKVWQLFPK